MGRRSKFSYSPWRREPEPPKRPCDVPGCPCAGEYRAPKDKSLKEYYWFCLEHVREYNAKWDYYADMTEAEIEQQLKDDYGWGRPTWDMSERIASRIFNDPLGLKREAFGDKDSQPKPAKKTITDPALTAAARILELTFPLDKKQVKTNYKRLAKICHPDTTGGDKMLEEKFKDITEAYRLIMTVLS